MVLNQEVGKLSGADLHSHCLQQFQDFRLTHPTCVIQSQDPGSHSRPKLPLVACRKIGQIRLLSTGRVVFLFAELDILCAQVNVLHDDFFVAFELRIWGQSVFSNLHYLDPIYLNLRLLLGFMMGFGLAAFLFRRQVASWFVRLDLGLALFPLEPIDLIALTLNGCRLLLNGGLLGFYHVHQIDDHLAHRFIGNRVRIEVF